MAKKIPQQSKPAATPAVTSATGVASSTAVRNSSIPKAQPGSPRVVTQEMIAKRAYEISQSHECGSEDDNWHRAERELKSL